MQITIHRGSHEIGGSCIELSSGGYHIFFDVGLKLKSRYGEDSIPASALEPLAKASAIFLSHAHPDHFGLIPQTPPHVPVYMSRGTSKLLFAGQIFSGFPAIDRSRQRIIRPTIAEFIGSIRVTAYAVDHSTFGCMAFFIECEGKRICYSGDLRFHGRKPGMARKILEYVNSHPVDILISEGTKIDSINTCWNEVELEQNVVLRLKNSPSSLCMGFFSPLNVDRLVTFYRASLRLGRVMVLDVYGAYVLYLLSTEARLPDPRRAGNIKVYYNQYYRKVEARKNLGKVSALFENVHIELEEILAAPGKFLMLCRPSMLRDDFGWLVPEGAVGLYSYWEGYLEDDSWKQVISAFKDQDASFEQFHCCGHANRNDLLEFIRALDPGAIIPVHSNAPSEFKRVFDDVILAEDGIPLEF